MVMAMGSREPMEVLEKEEVEEEQETEEEETGPERVIPCDDHTSCNDGNTCCSNGKQNKKWFCCPLPQVNIHNNKNTTATSSTRAASPSRLELLQASKCH